MRKTLLAVLALVFALSVSAMAQMPLMFNGDFEFEDPAAGWLLDGAASVWPAGQNSVPILSGNWAGTINSWDGSWTGPKGTIQQTVYGLTAGDYLLNFDYYIGVRSGDAGRNAGIKVLVDGVEVFSEFVTPELQWSGYWDWKNAVVPVAIASDMADITVEYHVHYAEWTWLGTDNFALSEVPEPGSIVALMSGLAGFGGMIIRRRK